MKNSVILTSYFSQKIHPNDLNDEFVIGRSSDGRVLQNSISYIQPWYNSVNELNLQGRIFYDNLSDDFITQYTTDKIKFIKVKPSDYSNNDWRFFCYKNYLEKNKFDSVFLTDGSDVTVVQNPSKIIEDFPEKDFFLCKDSIQLSQFPYLAFHKNVKWENYMYFLLNDASLALINMGVIGATYNNILIFLNNFCDVRIKLGHPEFNSDMWLGQYIFRHLLSDKKLLIG